jgi:tRNA dimethylallyltransferase
MDIGTAKPTAEDQALVPHHLLDKVTPDQRFTVADFKRLAEEAIADITARGKLPVMVGGTGLYIDSVLYDFAFAAADAERDPQNPRHLLKPVAQTRKLRPNTQVFGIQTDREVIERRIVERIDQMFERGLVQEIGQLSQQYDWRSPGLSAIGYREFEDYYNKVITLTEVKERIIIATRQYAKRQRTWLHRNPDIRWGTPEQILTWATEALT